MHLKHPISLSLIALCSTTVICIIVLYLYKPTVILKAQENKEINWGKLISLSIVFGTVVGIIFYLVTMKTPLPDTFVGDKVTQPNTSHCY